MNNSPVSSPSVPSADDAIVTKQQWKWSALAGMASYLDAGSIVALAASLAAFQEEFHLSKGSVGALQAIGPNAIGCAIGAFVGGWLGDKLGRKRIYQWDLLVYAAGILCMALSVNAGMLYVGTFVVGVAVGADVPTSLALVGEFAPARARGKLLGFTQVAWCLGPSVVLWMAMALAPLGLMGNRILFLHLFVVALITWALRRGLAESARWKAAAATAREQVSALLSPSNVRAMIWTGTIYLFWNLTAGTNGAFGAYFNRVLLGGRDVSATHAQAVGTGLASLSFLCTMLATVFLFMPFSDRSFRARKWLWGVGSILQIASWGMLMFVPYTVSTVFANTILFGVGAALAGEAFYKVFSQELFPTLQRGTAQGITFGAARVLLGIWSFVAPMLIDDQNPNFHALALMLTLFLVVSGAVGFFFMPDTSGKSLEQIAVERARS
ncbi:MAG TPA: MFS transporter [Opitutaceae bacterium]|nr:MFS transporter [Opitutaceae bacterium]